MCLGFWCCGAAFCAAPVVLISLLAGFVLVPPAPPCSVSNSLLGVCRSSEPAGAPAQCEEGVFLRVTKQPRIGLRHLVPGAGTPPIPVAEARNGDCVVQYSLACNRGVAELVDVPQGCHGVPGQQVPVSGSLSVCASPGVSLRLLAPVVDLSFDVEVPADTEVLGCVQVTSARELSHLAAVRGDTETQKAALVTRKEEVGGCATWATPDDRLTRGEDYARGVGGRLLRHLLNGYQKAALESALDLQSGTMISGISPRIAAAFISILLFSGHSSIFEVVSTINCGAPTRSLLPSPSIQVTRHADVARAIADPKQKRRQVIGMGFSEVCFDPTLTIFLSTGSPEHTQVRLLWDRVGLDRAHLGDLPEIRPTGAAPLFRQVLDGVGVTLPTPLDIAPLVAPIFLEKLWGKKPTAAESELISQYMTFGAGCIASNALEKLPFVPSKVKEIRKAALSFAVQSPVGLALAKEIEKPEFAAIRAKYAARPSAVHMTAVQNLADASMFAGLVGTSTLTTFCTEAVWHSKDKLRLFRQNATTFLWELSRVHPAVMASQTQLLASRKLKMGHVNVELPVGTSIVMSTSASGWDASVFPDPWKFDPSRPEIGEMLTWNGKLKDVIARNYSAAPRFCPGQLLSVRIAAHVCGYLSRHLKV